MKQEIDSEHGSPRCAKNLLSSFLNPLQMLIYFFRGALLSAIGSVEIAAVTEEQNTINVKLIHRQGSKNRLLGS